MNAQATAIAATGTPEVAAPVLKVAAEDKDQYVTTHGQRIDKATAKSASHYAISGVLVHPSADDGQVYLSATDGHVLGIVMAGGYVKAPSILPLDVISRKKSMAKYTLDGDTWQNLGDCKIAPATQGNFPKTVDVVPDLADDPLVVTLDVKKLAALADMIATDGKVTLMIGETNKPIGVRGLDGFGVVMPCESPTDPVTRFRADRAAYIAAWK